MAAAGMVPAQEQQAIHLRLPLSNPPFPLAGCVHQHPGLGRFVHSSESTRRTAHSKHSEDISYESDVNGRRLRELVEAIT